jgi:hypothetical protein
VLWMMAGAAAFASFIVVVGRPAGSPHTATERWRHLGLVDNPAKPVRALVVCPPQGDKAADS